MKKILIALLCLITCFSVIFAVGCNDNRDKGSGGNDKVILLADFETWETGFQLMRTVKYFGALDINTDKNFVKSGKQSMQLHPLGSYTSGSTPTIFYPTSSELFGFNYRDFRDVEKITFEFYNNEEDVQKVAVGLVTSIRTVDYFDKTSANYQELAPKSWTTITYSVNASALNIDCDVSNILGIYMCFENARSRDEADAPDLYLDDIRIYKLEEKQEIVELVDLDENEYIDFEKDWQEYVVSVRPSGEAPQISIVDESEVVITEGVPFETTSGSKLLKVVASVGTTKSGSYPGMTFSKSLLQKSIFSSIDLLELGAVTFSFDVYAKADYDTYAGVAFYNEKENKRYEAGMYFYANTWTTFSINLKDLYEKYQAKNQNNTELFTSPGTIQIYWPEFIEGTSSREFYFDNFRFEVEEIDENTLPEITIAPFKRVARVGTTVNVPTMTVTDKYDFTFKTSVKPYYYNGETWEEVSLVSGKIPIENFGEYKLIATAENHFGNVSTKEYYFKGVASVESNVFATYDYADETSNVMVVGEKTATNCSTYLADTSNEGLNGAVKYGVIKAQTSNAEEYGAGYFGLRFANEFIEEAESKKWIAMQLRVYIKASVSEVDIFSWNKKLAENVKTNCWTTITITKESLKHQTWLNGSEVAADGTTLPDKSFYQKFATLFCREPAERMFFIRDAGKSNPSFSEATYYFDQVTYLDGNYVFEDGDDVVSDIYPEVNLGDLGIIKKED